jgi:predicted short-subunit dehydrogenase-like oxidoreductase (DUF2520 family)
MLRIFVHGAGRAGKALATALRSGGLEIVGLHGRRSTPASAESAGVDVTSGRLPEAVALADVVLVTVRDSQIDAAISELLAAELRRDAVVLHASGSTDPRSIEMLRERGYAAGTFHPLVPINAASDASARLRGAWIGIDGDVRAREAAAVLAGRLGAHTIDIPEGRKAIYHAAAVLASNFPSALAYLAQQLLASAGVGADDASAAVVSLMHKSVENLRGRDPAAALSGPVVRGDYETVKTHLDALIRSGADDALAVYVALTRVAVEMARRNDPDREELIRIEEAISQAL